MKVFDFIPEGIGECNVTAWIHTYQKAGVEQQLHPAIIICPGGGYVNVSAREAEPVAKPYFAAGYNTYILTYSVGEKAKSFYPLCQLAATIAHVRNHASEWNTAADQIAVCGFSAGGHLAASLGTLYDEPEFLTAFDQQVNYSEDTTSEKQQKCSIRPDAMILGYPVITADEYAHQGSIEKVSDAEPGSERYAWFGLDKHVDGQTPPVFLWHTAADEVVPVENSLKMCLALSHAKVSFEFHVFPEGEHGMSVCTEEVGTPSEYNARWMEWSIEWLNKLFNVR